MKRILLLAVLLVLAAACTPDAPHVKINSNVIVVDVAQTQDEKSLGLMFRDHLDEDKGMIFLFDKDQELSFWMKNTLIPLDMIFINNNYEIVDIQTAIPCERNPCEHYDSFAQYVLEVNAGYSEKHNIQVGDKVEFVLNP